MRAANGLAERLRRDPRPRRRRLPAGARRRRWCPPAAATCRARWCSRRAGRRATGWVIVRDVLLHRALAPRGGALRQPPALADRLRRRARARAHGPVRPGVGGDPPRLRAGVRLRRRWRPSGSTRAPATTRRTASSEGMELELRARHRHAPRLRGPARDRRARSCARATSRSPRSGWSEAPRCRRPTRRPTSAWCARRTTGRSGSSTATFPDHPWRTLPAAQRADAQGTDLRADRAR